MYKVCFDFHLSIISSLFTYQNKYAISFIYFKLIMVLTTFKAGDYKDDKNTFNKK